VTSAIDFPSGTTGISRAYDSIKITTHMPAIRTLFESGYVQTRGKFTRARKEFTLSWRDMSKNSYVSLQTFFESGVTGGSSSFNFSEPTSGSTYEVRFLSDSISFTNYNQNYFSGSIDLREV